MSRPNVLWLMSDQHNANCTSYNNHPNVKTPHLDRIAARGVNFNRAYANNPICSPSRICFMTGQYMRNHQMYGNYHAEWPTPNPDTLACVFRRYGYQTAMFGKSHMTRRWDDDGFEHIRYTDLCDAKAHDPMTCHYFQYLDERGLADKYEEGVPLKGHIHARDGSKPALLPYEHCIERYTGDETLKFLDERDANRPFFIKMSFQRPHEPITPAPEYFDMYDPEEVVLPDNAYDYFENKFAGKPKFQQNHMQQGGIYPLADPDPNRLKRCLASYYALISQMDDEIGRVLDALEKSGELENTIIMYCSDHGDFAGEHGIFHKNFGIYESIQRIPFLMSWPGGPQGKVCDDIVESVDWYTTVCDLCDVPVPENRDGKSLVPVANGEEPGKDTAYCEWHWGHQKIMALRTDQYRLVYYQDGYGELYDHHADPGETNNLWDQEATLSAQTQLLKQLFSFSMGYRPASDMSYDRTMCREEKWAPSNLIHKKQRFWSELKDAYEKETTWPSS